MPLSDPQRDYVAKHVRTLQIIVLALAAGAASFAIFTYATSRQGEPRAAPRMMPAAVTLTAVAIVVALVLPNFLARRQRQSVIDRTASSPLNPPPGWDLAGDVAPLLVGHQTRVVIAAAVLEGAAFLNVVAFQIERNAVNLWLAAGLIVLILGLLPTRGRVEWWLENDLRTIDQLRAFQKSS